MTSVEKEIITEQDPPFCVQVFLTEGCNIHVPRPDGTEGLCWFCGINGIREKPGDYKFMSLETAELIADQIAKAGWGSQILFAGHGEPSLNPNIEAIMGAFRKRLPRAYLSMLSNGGGLIKKGRIAALFDAGINTVAVEDYKGAGLLERVDWDPRLPTLHYPQDKDASPHMRKTTKRQVIISSPLEVTSGNHSAQLLNNHAGMGLPPITGSQHKRCAKPFREMSIAQDGTVIGCCIDWRGQLDHGNVHQKSIEQIWQEPTLQAMRRLLLAGRRDKIDLCRFCDQPSYRLGLLPDKFGKKTMAPWTEEDAALLNGWKSKWRTQPIVFRPWEKPVV